ncbi:MAG TPA: endonuclease NucS domain-containing protein [Humisphaera sp.]|nr:endonuclease NucS domain-containing protein [Humisphaera sp.]
MPIPQQVLGKLRTQLAEMRRAPIWKQIVEPRDDVLSRFQPLFSASHLPELTEDEFKPFLYKENNHHWTGLFRSGPRLCEDMPRLRRVLATLLDESHPIQSRLDEVTGLIKGFGKATITAILHVAKPDAYGVWNNTSAGALVALRLFPEFNRGEKFGSSYAKFNTVLVELAKSLDIDLWTLDGLWWFLQEGDTAPLPLPPITGVAIAGREAPSHVFGLERHLQDFLFENWNKLEIGGEWMIYGTPADEDAGYEYACPVGRIDLLAKHRTHKKWLVVELKRNDTSDSVVGQVLRYMGWIKQHLAEPGDEVHGLVIAREGDDALHYAVSTVPNLTFQVYEVEFRLRAPPSLMDKPR